MFELKPLSKEAIPHALEKAAHYRLLNQPWQTESICRDILQVHPGDHQALLNLILAITDQFPIIDRSFEAKELCKQLPEEYERLYYVGLIAERLGKAALGRSGPRVKYIAYEHYRTALEYYERSEQISPIGNQDAVLRWNACVRTIAHFKLESSPDEDRVESLLDV
ncbi:MAG: hypothetical protein IPL46_20135 [Saprospiraceae bacterium]|nr:hypothetical protein [Saprospiraceae bacterium]